MLRSITVEAAAAAAEAYRVQDTGYRIQDEPSPYYSA
jgi:hypothetical protein